MRSVVAGHQKLTTTKRASWKVILLQLHEKLPKNSIVTIIWLFGTGSKLEQWKSLIRGCLMSWTKIKNIIILKCRLFLFYTRAMKYFSIRFWHVTKSGFYTTTSDNQLSGCMEKKFPSTSQSQTCTKKMSRSLFGGLWPNSSTTAFWIPAKPLHLRSMLSKWMRCTKSATPAASTGQQKGPSSSLWQLLTAHHTTNASKAEWTGLQSFASSVIFTWPLANWLPLLQASWQLCAGKMLSQSGQHRKCFPIAHQIPTHGFFLPQE